MIRDRSVRPTQKGKQAYLVLVTVIQIQQKEPTGRMGQPQTRAVQERNAFFKNSSNILLGAKIKPASPQHQEHTSAFGRTFPESRGGATLLGKPQT